MYAGKKKLRCEGHLYDLRYYFTNPNGEDVQKWVPNMVFKFHKDPTVNEFGIIALLGQVWVYAGKRRFWEEKEKTDLRGRESEETYDKCQTWPTLSLFIARFLLFTLLLFYEKKLYFISYQMNK